MSTLQANKDAEVKKRLDTQMNEAVFRRSNVTIYWLNQLFQNLYGEFRPGFSKVLPKGYDPFDQASVIRKFKLNGFEYGNWLTQEDRYNYFLAAQIALFDLQGVLQFGYNLGLNKTIGIAFGARGKSAANGHFEPDTFMINITRYKEAKKLLHPLTGQPVFGDKTTGEVKSLLFEKTGGVGSLAHEYGHSLDYYFGTYIDQDRKYNKYRSLTQGWSISDDPDTDYRRDSLRYDANMIIHSLIWENEREYTKYYKVLKDANDKGIISDYWLRHVELFARSFETYIHYKLDQKGIKNTFLTHGKYEGSWPYPDKKLLKRLIPHFDSLITKMRNRL